MLIICTENEYPYFFKDKIETAKQWDKFIKNAV